MWVGPMDNVTLYRSLTARGKVQNADGSWLNMEVVTDTGACCTLISETTETESGRFEHATPQRLAGDMMVGDHAW